MQTEGNNSSHSPIANKEGNFRKQYYQQVIKEDLDNLMQQKYNKDQIEKQRKDIELNEYKTKFESLKKLEQDEKTNSKLHKSFYRENLQHEIDKHKEQRENEVNFNKINTQINKTYYNFLNINFKERN